jgi:hypothetical protein
MKLLVIAFCFILLSTAIAGATSITTMKKHLNETKGNEIKYNLVMVIIPSYLGEGRYVIAGPFPDEVFCFNAMIAYLRGGHKHYEHITCEEEKK